MTMTLIAKIAEFSMQGMQGMQIQFCRRESKMKATTKSASSMLSIPSSHSFSSYLQALLHQGDVTTAHQNANYRIQL